ncbi:MAG: pyridoxamine 5'-phosphate oxidase [bacterium]
MNIDIAQMRKEYLQRALLENEVDLDPIVQFQKWFADAVAANLPEPEAMTLATCTTAGKPSARIVLLKGCDQQGFIFFTNYNSRKGHELSQNAFAALVFWWVALERQIRIEGRVEEISAEESDRYFRTRPRGSQLGAWVSQQSQVAEGREIIEARLRELEKEFDNREVPRPPHWGGFRLIPEAIEFWQGRPNRLHDRLRYHKGENGEWTIKRLWP